MPENYGPVTEAKIAQVKRTCDLYGQSSIIALSGVPGTGKSFVAQKAAQRIASDPLMVREIQFHPTYSYEEFIEGYRADPGGGFVVTNGAFLDWNYRAMNDPDHTYVLLIEELSRANLPSVLGELLTYIEYRDREFYTLYGRTPVTISEKLRIIATFNPRDRSALEMDDALIRRLRIIDCPPDAGQLNEMLRESNLSAPVKAHLGGVFEKCRQFCEADGRPEDYSRLMPFGHGIFADIASETPDLHLLWKQRIEYLLAPPGRQRHPFFDVISDNYPWKESEGFALADAGGAARG